LKDGIKPYRGLREEELKAIKELAQLCNEADSTRLKLNWDMLKGRSSEVTNDFLYYDNGTLIGFLGLYSFNSSEVEISGMVHPNHRRLGIFSALVEAAKHACMEREIPKLLFICQNGSASGKAFLEALGAEYSFSEYRMEMDMEHKASAKKESDTQGGLVQQPEGANKAIQLRLADQGDIELLVALNVDGFTMSEQDARGYVEQSIEEAHDRTYIADQQGVPIGKICVQAEEGSGFIFGFCVNSANRGKGAGRSILAQAIAILLKKDRLEHIALEVAVENEGALGLYESCGFRKKYAYDYYSYKGHVHA
jgi:ribosomal protein S18 acetylase RimI-like enzyme